MRALRLYRDLLRPRSVRRLFVASAAGRVPSGMMSLALLLLIHGTSGSYAVAGMVVGAYNVAGAGAAPVMGRLIDRCGARCALAAGGVVQPLALVGVVLLSHASPPAAVLVLACGVAGAALPPPVTGAMRSLWPRLVAANRRGVAYSLEAVATEVVFIAGPVLVAVFISVGSAGGAVLAAAALSAGGSLGMALAAPGRDRPLAADRRRSRSPLAQRGFRVLLIIAAADATALGCLELAVAGRATEAGKPALTGILLSLMACASVVGGLWFGGRTWRTPPLAPVRMAPRVHGDRAGARGSCAGAGRAGAGTCAGGRNDRPRGRSPRRLNVATIAPADVLGEAFTWVAAVSFAGYSLGTTSGGHVMESGEAWRLSWLRRPRPPSLPLERLVLRSALRPATPTAA